MAFGTVLEPEVIEMTAISQFRGHKMEFHDGAWEYADTKDLVSETWEGRPCGHCGRGYTPDGHDGCLGALPGVENACCGHGVEREAYVQFVDGPRFDGRDAIDWVQAVVPGRGEGTA